MHLLILQWHFLIFVAAFEYNQNSSDTRSSGPGLFKYFYDKYGFDSTSTENVLMPKNLTKRYRVPADAEVIVLPYHPPPKTPAEPSNLYIFYDKTQGLYRVVVDIGNPKQEDFNLILSSSCDLSIFRSTKCEDCNMLKYDGDNSTSSRGWNETSKLISSDSPGGAYSGMLITDRINIGSITAYRVKILAASDGTTEAKTGDHDGVLSLKYGHADGGFFDKLMQSPDIHHKVMAVILFSKRQKKSNGIKAGILFLGERNAKYFIDPMAFSYINSKEWALTINSFSIDTKELCTQGPCLGYINLDVQYVLIHHSFYKTILAAINGTRFANGLITLNCDDAYLLPTINFNIGKVKFELEGPAYTVEDDAGLCFTIFKVNQLVKSLEFVFGTYFMEHFYIELGVYSVGKASAKGVGIAKKRKI